MKAEELRLFNLVLVDGEVKKVGQLKEDGVYCIIPSCKRVYSVHMIEWNEVEGIPLTEEWLLKLGFEIKFDYGDSKDYFHPYTRDFYVSIDHDDIAFKYNAKSGYYCIFYADDRLQYVHQLQNLYYALTGSELTIKWD